MQRVKVHIAFSFIILSILLNNVIHAKLIFKFNNSYKLNGYYIFLPDSPIVKNDPAYLLPDNDNSPPLTPKASGLFLKNPENIKTKTNYNPKTKTFEISQKIGKSNYRPTNYVNFQDYHDALFKQAMRNHFKSKIKADDLKKPEDKSKSLLKGLQVQINNDIFERIFGGNTIELKPTGSIELFFGLVSNTNENPAITLNQQTNTIFDFNQKMQLSLTGRVGKNISVTFNYNTEASFEWENQIKFDFNPIKDLEYGEDWILKSLEVGNVSMPLNTTLIQGSQTLFGIKTKLQFNRLTTTLLFAQDKGKRQEITLKGGSQLKNFNISADNYETNKHFFLGHYFADNYDKWMESLPLPTTPIIITKIEVYMTNQTGNMDQSRSFVGFADLGEDISKVTPKLSNTLSACQTNPNFVIRDALNQAHPHNDANTLYAILTNTNNGIMPPRSLANASGINAALTGAALAPNVCNSNNSFMLASRDFEYIANARKLNPSEYTFNARLGYLSINQTVNNDVAVAVAYQYSYNGQIYQVGEFSDQFNTGPLYLKLLKSGSVVSPLFSTWELMMKNVYSIQAYNISPDDFRCDVYYNNISTGVDIPYIPLTTNNTINGKMLVQVLNLDKLSVNGDLYADGVYDFIKDYTINPMNGRLYFSTRKPFGASLRKKFSANDFPAANKYIFDELYDSTRVVASLIANKNRYKIKGSYKSSGGADISLNTMNVPQGAVLVTANGQRLQENTHFTVDYNLGMVKIIDESILNSGANIKVSVESNSMFNVQQKTLYGTRLDYKISKNFNIGGTFMHLNERPLTQKVNVGEEPVSNTIWGVDYKYSTDAPFITTLLDKLPFYNTKAASSIVTQAEFAHLIPGNASAIGANGGNAYIDDFEGSVATIDIKSPYSWKLASIPQGQPDMFPEASLSNDLSIGMNRSQFNWYTIDPLYFGVINTNSKPANITPISYSNHFMRQILETELFPDKTAPNGQPISYQVLDLAYYPSERGPYNYDVLPTVQTAGIVTTGTNVGRLASPETRWGGIMRKMETNDFQAANIEYIQFWMLDPFNDDYKSSTHPDMDQNNKPSGELYFNIGNISEDILKDGQMSYENGLPGSAGGVSTYNTNLATTPVAIPITNVFLNTTADRMKQDVGYDGLDDADEKTKLKPFVTALSAFTGKAVTEALNDPSSDNYHFHRGAQDYDILPESQANTIIRYKKFNNPQGNSPTVDMYPDANVPSAASMNPNIEDLNNDNTLSEIENYYQYRIKISPNDINPGIVGKNHIVNRIQAKSTNAQGVTRSVDWYQFKIPISEYQKKVGSIEGFNSIRFMRVFMKGFSKPVICRMARLELVRSDWRKYAFDLRNPGLYIGNDNKGTSFDVSAINLLENGSKTPVNYVLPPGIEQQQNVQTINNVLLNEQAMALRVCGIEGEDSRAITKNIEMDMRSFKKLRLFVHAEKFLNQNLNDDDLNLFVRIGSDFNNNYYEYEIPLKLTAKGFYNNNGRDKVWPSENEVVIDFEKLVKIKLSRNGPNAKLNSDLFTKVYSEPDPDNPNKKITVLGNPNLSNVKSLMIGIRNPGMTSTKKCVEVWVNEMRLTDFINSDGWAVTGNIQTKLADLGDVNLTASYSTPFFGSIDKRVSERNRETTLQWDAVTKVQLGVFFPEKLPEKLFSSKLKINLPFYYNYGETKITPQFNPYDPDVLTDNKNINPEIKDQLLQNAQDVTIRRGFNFSNVSVQGLKLKFMPAMPWDISNFTATYAFNQIQAYNVNVENNLIQTHKASLTYNYQSPLPAIKPFASSKNKFLNLKWMALVKEMNLNLLPNTYGFSIELNKSYSEMMRRDMTSFYTGQPNMTIPLFNKLFNVTRTYNVGWTITNNLKFDFNATNTGRIFEPRGRITNQTQEDTITNNILQGGVNTNYRHTVNLTYQVPINKIPIFDFINLSTTYNGSYNWNRRPFAQEQLGNTIQNTNTKSGTGSFNFLTLYNKIPYFKRVIEDANKQPNLLQSLPEKDLTKGLTKPQKDSVKKKELSIIGKSLAKLIMMFKQGSITYNEGEGTGLSLFKGDTKYVGMDQNFDAPGVGFISGFNDNILQKSVQNNWVYKSPNIMMPYTNNLTKALNYRLSLEPHSSLKIDLSGNVNHGENNSLNVRYDSISHSFKFETPVTTGNYNVSIMPFTFGSLFDNSTSPNTNSKEFNNFLNNRDAVAQELGSMPGSFSKGRFLYVNSQGVWNLYQDGYNDTQQDVLIGSFYNTYTGSKLSNPTLSGVLSSIPIPNWNITWDGLSNLKLVKKWFNNITLRHSYTSKFTIGAYNNNLLYIDGVETRVPVASTGTGQSPNLNSKHIVNTAIVTEAFSPLIKIDLRFVKSGFTSNFEIKKDKTITLNTTAPNIIESSSQEYVFGFGYRIDKLILKFIKLNGKSPESPLTIKVDLSYRKTATIIRSIIYQTSTPSAGQDIFSLRSSADYPINSNINARLYFDWSGIRPVTSPPFPTSTWSSGISLRITL